MQILFDECVHRCLPRDLQGHEVKTARQVGWATAKDGELLALAAEAVDVFVTVDRRLTAQQDLNGLAVVVVVSCARDEVAQENRERVQDGAMVRRAGGRSPMVCVVGRFRAVSGNCAGGQNGTIGDSDRRP